MISPTRRKYATATTYYMTLYKAGSGDHALTTDYTPVAGDVKISIDGAAPANIGTLPEVLTMGNGAFWKFTLTAAELTGKIIIVSIADADTPTITDDGFIIETYGHASALHPGEFVAVDGIAADALTSAAYTALGENVGASVLDAFTADHTVAGTVGKAIGDAASNSASILDDTGTSGVALSASSIDNILDEPIPEDGAPAWPVTIRTALAWLIAVSRNKATQTSTTSVIRNDADNADLATSAVSDNGTQFTRGEWT